MPREREQRTAFHDRPTVFLSHAQTDAGKALKLKNWFTSTFTGGIRVFASCDSENIPKGAIWFDTIDRALRDCALGVVLLTETSIRRPWVNYELGALRMGRKRTIPLCVIPVTKTQLFSPFRESQACDYSSSEDRLDLLRSIAESCGFDPEQVPAEAANRAPELPPGPEPKPTLVPGGHDLPLERLFNTDDRWTTVIYTCRATFTGEECPHKSSNIIGDVAGEYPIKRALWTHVPIDEVQTVCVAINHLLSPDLRANEDDILHTVACSKRAEGSLRETLGESATRGSIPPLVNRDLIIVGENNFSNLLLQMLQPYLPWQSGWQHIVVPGGQKLRPDVYLELVDRFNAPATAPDQKRYLHKGSAMIAIFPNPFDVRRRVIILFGCHRDGQFTLEEWLRGKEVQAIVDDIAMEHHDGATAIQVVVDRTRPLVGGVAGPAGATAVRNVSDGRQFWRSTLNRFGAGNTVVIDSSCAEAYEIYDLSLVVALPEEEQVNLSRVAEERVGMPDLYWERGNCEIGFHVTLFEFLTHQRPDPSLLTHLEMLTHRLSDSLTETHDRDALGKTIARIRGIEFLSRAMVSYVDFLDEDGKCSNWLEFVRRWCERAVAHATYRAGNDLTLLNAMRVPFPAHVTLCRFDREIPDTQESKLKHIADQWRAVELLRFTVEKPVLVAATKAPYRAVTVSKQLHLA